MYIMNIVADIESPLQTYTNSTYPVIVVADNNHRRSERKC